MKKTCVVLTCTCLFSLLAEASIRDVTIGMPEAEVIKAMGLPQGNASGPDFKMLFYDGGEIELRQGKVARIAPKFEQRAQERKEAAKRAEDAKSFKEKAKVKWDGFTTWAKAKVGLEASKGAPEPTPQNNPAPPPPSVTPVKVLKQGGQAVDLNKVLVAGQVTVVDFYADWCGPCKRIGPKLDLLAKQDSGVVLRKVDIVRWGTPVAEQYSINSIPHIRVYDARGKMVGQPTSDFQQVVRNVALAK